jgi:protein-S-isoprenylcysteine O-methyltransferase Ste14
VVAVPHGALVAAGGLAWTARRTERWRWQERWSWPYLAAAVGLLVAAWFPWVVEPLVEGGPVDAGVAPLPWSLDPLDVVRHGSTVALAVLLVGAARLPRRLAAGLLLGVVAQTLPVTLLAVHQALRGGGVVTSFGWLALLSAMTLAIFALWWRDVDQREEQQRRGSLADVAGLT